MIYDTKIGERCETGRTWFERWLNKKALLSSRTAEPGKNYKLCFTQFMIIVATDYISYSHISLAEHNS